jgi:hypothetical protein
MANIPNRAVKKIRNDIHREIAAGILIAYGLFPRTNEGIAAAQRLIAGRETWLAPSDLPNYYDDIESDLMMGRETAGITNIRMVLKEFYGLNDTKPKSQPKLKPVKPQVNNKPTKKEPETGETTIYKPDDKFVDDITENLEKKLEETSDQMMDVVDALIEKQKKDFEDFKRRQEEERKQKQQGENQYPAPIGPDPIQGPVEPPVQGPKEPPKKTVAPEKDEDWESEVPDQLGTKLDELLDQVQNEPLPQPTQTKRRKTKGKRKLGRKMPKIKGSEMGLSQSLSEIYENVVETREALFKLYKLNKERFEFKKKVDAKLSQMMEAKLRERALEKPEDEKKDDGRYKDDDKKKKKSLLKDSLMAGLSAMLLSVAVPAIISGLGLFFSDGQTEDTEEQDAALKEEVNAADVDDVADGLEQPQSLPPETPALPGPTSQPAVAQPAFQLPNTAIPGDYDYQPPVIPAAAKGGKFTVNGSKGGSEPLLPLQRKDKPQLPAVKKLTKPLNSAIGLPQKAATAGMLSFAAAALSPFAGLMPKETKGFINNIFRDIASSAGITGLDIKIGDSQLDKLFSELKAKIESIFKLKSGDDDGPSGPSGPGGGDGSVGTGPGGSGQDFATLATIAALESGSAQGQADVAQSVYNRLGDTGQLYGKSITEILTRKGQYQVAFKDPTASSGAGTDIADVFKNIKTEDDAVKAIMYYFKGRGQNITPEQARKKFQSASKAISDPKLQAAAAKHVGGRTEFLSSGQYKAGDAWRGGGSDNTYFAKYGSRTQMQRGAQAIPEGLFNKSVSGLSPTKSDMDWYKNQMSPPQPAVPPKPAPGKGDGVVDKISRAFSAVPGVVQAIQPPAPPNPMDLLNNFSSTQSSRSSTSKNAAIQPPM